MFDLIVWGGAALTLLGLAGLVWCIVRVTISRKHNLNDDEMRALLQSLVPLNLGSLFVSAIGLMAVVVGLILG